MERKKSNQNLQSLISELKKKSIDEKVNIWKRIACDLEKPTRSRRYVNLYKLSLFTKENETVIVPGKVLGTGDLTHPLTVVAFNFSASAKDKINKVGKTLSIPEFVKQNPKGSNVRIIG